MIRSPQTTGPALLVLLAAATSPPASARAQESADNAEAAHATLTPHGDLRMLLEKTIFKVDVLSLDVWFETATQQRLDSLAADHEYDDDTADSVATIALAAHAVEARVHFWRDISFEQFLDAVDDDLEKTVKAGLATEEGRREVVEGLPEWFDFLHTLGPRRNDEITYRIRGDTLHTTYRRATGETVYDDVLIGPTHRNGVLGPYFAPKTSFRKKLIASLWER